MSDTLSDPDFPALVTDSDSGAAGLPRRVLQARVRLGPDATPEAVAADLRAGGMPEATAEAVKSVWDEERPPA